MRGCFFVTTFLALGLSAFAEPVGVIGSATATAPLKAASAKLKQAGLEITVDSGSTTTAAIDSVANGGAGLAVGTRPVTSEERAANPSQKLEESPIGVHLLALVVSRDVWDSGVRALTQEQMLRIYEGDVTNWKSVGGADRAIKFFNPEQGQGIWETFVTWLYGDVRKAPLGNFESVRGGEQTRDLVEFQSGALSVIPVTWVDGRGTYALSIKSGTGELLAPTLASVKENGYPLARRLTLISADRPYGVVKKIIDFMAGPSGREFLLKADFVPFHDAPPAP